MVLLPFLPTFQLDGCLVLNWGNLKLVTFITGRTVCEDADQEIPRSSFLINKMIDFTTMNGKNTVLAQVKPLQNT
ncbi:hypothetical protein [Cylindrospermum sp. FACHB-282]|uniref:hypothetical protein n=1 Tax=Cylindrospermum sp. FACHB-282 TaxID=2692794 RepID=UPI001685E31E|nr:hypothetical protein [Cylindrospermum sp. FACHB-282]MBD2384051.1 hypothetical protein [Cylindrospermum sp. FACHB-282]